MNNDNRMDIDHDHISSTMEAKSNQITETVQQQSEHIKINADDIINHIINTGNIPKYKLNDSRVTLKMDTFIKILTIAETFNSENKESERHITILKNRVKHLEVSQKSIKSLASHSMEPYDHNCKVCFFVIFQHREITLTKTIFYVFNM